MSHPLSNSDDAIRQNKKSKAEERARLIEMLEKIDIHQGTIYLAIAQIRRVDVLEKALREIRNGDYDNAHDVKAASYIAKLALGDAR